MKRLPVPSVLRWIAALGAVLATTFVLSATAQAHHSAAMFDTTKVVTITGAIKDIKWANPHVHLEVVAAGAGGAQTVWSVECSPPSILVRRGWSVNSLKAGDTVTMKVNPVRDGGPAAYLLNVTTPSGAVLKDHDY